MKIYVFEFPHTSWNFSFFFTLATPGKSRHNKAQPLNIPQNCETPGNSTCYFFDPRKFHILSQPPPFLFGFFPNIPSPSCLEIPFPQAHHPLPCLAFFWNSPSKVKNQDLKNFTALSLSSLEIPCQCPLTHRPQVSVWVFFWIPAN